MDGDTIDSHHSNEESFTSYDIDIPLMPRLDDPLRHDPTSYEQTTTFIEDASPLDESYYDYGDVLDSDLDQQSTAESRSSISHSHGFFFGTRSSFDDLEFRDEGGKGGKADDDDEFEDEGLGEIYRPTAGSPMVHTRGSKRSFEFSPESTPRHVLSQRIGNVGVIGQNIALGHRLGLMTDDSSLIPKAVTFLNDHSILVTEDCPTQIEIKWSKPKNSTRFVNVVYSIETSIPDSEGEPQTWTELSSSHQPLFRIYHTDDKLLVGKHHVTRRDRDVIVRLRVRCQGEILAQDRTRHWIMSSYSHILDVTFVGYESKPKEIQLTYL